MNDCIRCAAYLDGPNRLCEECALPWIIRTHELARWCRPILDAEREKAYDARKTPLGRRA